MSKTIDLGTCDGSRELDVQVASILYHIEHLHPSWYRYEVLAFYEEGNPLIRYSYDEDACNAKMHANGVNSDDGTADSLPYYSSDPTAFKEVIDYVRKHGGQIAIGIFPLCSVVSVRKATDTVISDVPDDYVAPASSAYLDESDIALAGCTAFVAVYGGKQETSE
jgi:hypothetical protein